MSLIFRGFSEKYQKAVLDEIVEGIGCDQVRRSSKDFSRADNADIKEFYDERHMPKGVECEEVVMEWLVSDKRLLCSVRWGKRCIGMVRIRVKASHEKSLVNSEFFNSPCTWRGVVHYMGMEIRDETLNSDQSA